MNLPSILQRTRISAFTACRQCLERNFRALTTSTRSNAESSPLGDFARTESDKEKSKLAFELIFGPSAPPSMESTATFNISPYTASDLKKARPHHFHVYATKHNTHITLTNPDRDSMISLSAGNIGFRKGARGTYDAAYQLAALVLGRIYGEGLLDKIRKLEVILRGFGIGREAVTKALLGAEGRLLRSKITQVSDATRLKFGGTRSKKPRRLG